LRSSIPLELIGVLCNQTGSGKIQDGGLKTSNAYSSISSQDIYRIQTATTAIPMHLGSKNQLQLVGILCDQTGSGKIQDGGI